MAVQIDKEVAELFSDRDTVKVLATTDAQGVPHAALKQTLHLDEDGNLVYLELLESSKTNKNLVWSLWFDRSVSIALGGKNRSSYQIIGKPIKTHITGPLFKKYYVKIRDQFEGKADLAAVWIIKPEQVINQTFFARKVEEEARHPTFKHLDLLAKQTA